MTSKPRPARLWWISLALLVSCSKRAGEQSSPPHGGDGAAAESSPAGDAGGRDLRELEQQLARHADELQTVSEEHAVGADAATSEQKCARICELQTTICGIADAICGLADDHTDEVEYTDACTRARDQCTRAEEACNACSA